MKIGIIGAMGREITLLKKKLNNLKQEEIAGSIFYSGDLHGVDVVLLQSGIGKVAAAIGTSLLLDHFKPTHVINIGSAGGLDSSLNLGDVVISNEVAYHDADVTAFGYVIGQMARQPSTFKSDAALIAITENALEKVTPPLHAVKGLICTGDVFVSSSEMQNKIRTHFPNVIATEMEAAAIAQTCHQFKVPFVVVRAISDVADKASPMTFEEFLPLAAKSASDMVEEMLKLMKP